MQHKKPLKEAIEEAFRSIKRRRHDAQQFVRVRTPSYLHSHCLIINDPDLALEPDPVCKIGQHMYRHITFRWGERQYTGFLRCHDASPQQPDQSEKCQTQGGQNNGEERAAQSDTIEANSDTLESLDGGLSPIQHEEYLVRSIDWLGQVKWLEDI